MLGNREKVVAHLSMNPQIIKVDFNEYKLTSFLFLLNSI